MYKIFDTEDEASRYTAERLAARIEAKPDAVLGLATGGTMEPVYARLVERLQQGPVDASRLTTFDACQACWNLESGGF